MRCVVYFPIKRFAGRPVTDDSNTSLLVYVVGVVIVKDSVHGETIFFIAGNSKESMEKKGPAALKRTGPGGLPGLLVEACPPIGVALFHRDSDEPVGEAFSAGKGIAVIDLL